MDTENQSAAAPQWAVVELMGHVRYGGLVSKDNQFGTAMLRVDVPQADGSFVSQLINPASIYRITMCSEELGRTAAKQGDAKPMSSWEMRHLLPAPKEEAVPGEVAEQEGEKEPEFPTNMLNNAISAVTEFHRAVGQPIAEELNFNVPPETRALRVRLIIEEYFELLCAADIVETADALADMAYIVAGTAITYGLQQPVQFIFDHSDPGGVPACDIENGFRIAMSAYLGGEGTGRLIHALAGLKSLAGLILAKAQVDGIPIQAVFDEVHASNMSKLGADGKPVLRADGKVLKGPGYFPPDIARALVDAGAAFRFPVVFKSEVRA